MSAAAGDRGVSLLELVAVMAIFSVVAVMSMNLLTSAMNAQTRIAAAEGDVPALTAALAVLRRDLEQMQPVAGLTRDDVALVPGGFDLSREGARLSLVTGSDAGTGWQVDWVLEADGRLIRQARALAQDRAAPPVVMARGVLAWDLRVAAANGDWVTTTAIPVEAVPAPPRGVRIDLMHDSLGALRLVAAR